MNGTSQVNTPPISMPCLTLWLRRTVGPNGVGAWIVERVIAKAGGFKHNLTFDQDPLAQDCLAKEIWTNLLSYLPDSSGDKVFAARDVYIEAPDVLLQGLTVTAHQSKPLLQRAVVNVKTIIGSLHGIFARGRFPNILREAECDLSAKALNDILLPALSYIGIMSHDAPSQNTQRTEAFARRLQHNAREVEFYASLLTRFVAARTSGNDMRLPEMPPAE